MEMASSQEILQNLQNDTRNNPIMLGTTLPCNYSKASGIADKISPYALLKCQWNEFSIYKINLYSTEYLI